MTREQVQEILKDSWCTFELTGPEDRRARLCPLCSSWVWSSDKHREWHLVALAADARAPQAEKGE